MKKDIMLSCRVWAPRDRAAGSFVCGVLSVLRAALFSAALFTLSPQTWFGVFDPDTI